MTPQRRRSNQNRRGASGGGQAPRKPRTFDLWRPVPRLPPTEPITPASDPTALLRSLGDAPLPGSVSEHYMAAVIERAATLATALAASAGLLANLDDDL